ncbi:FAD-binding oxidoreductase [Thermocatellispora tengchongensis]
MADRRPALIAHCGSAAEVAAAVRAGRAAGVPISVRGGGHQVAGLAVRDDALVIDLSGLRGGSVDPARRVAHVGGGSLLGDVDALTQKYGFMVPAGVISHTGLGGLALGGGVGWTCRHFGLTCDSIMGAHVVTADGEQVYAGEHGDPDLLWALRGGGGNFGVVTTFELAVQNVTDVLLGQAVFELRDAPRAAAHFREVMAAAPDAVTAVLVLKRAPALPVVPPDLVGRPSLVINAVWSGPLAQGEKELRWLVEEVNPASSRIVRMPYLQVQSMQDDMHPHGLRNYMKSRYLTALDAGAIESLAAACEEIPGAMSQIEVLALGGAVARVADDATAFAGRQAAYVVNIVATWPSAAEDEAHIQWARRGYTALDRVGSDAGYVNFLGEEPDRARSVYPGRTYDRLQAVKVRIDPENVFQGNVPILPKSVIH